LKHFVAFISKQ